MVHAYQRKVTDGLRADWERTRWQTWWLVNIQLSKTDQLKSPKDLQRFPWEGITEKPAAGRAITLEEFNKK